MNLPGPGNFLPPDPPPSIYDDQDNLRDVLEDAGIPDYLADILAFYAYRGWKDDDHADLMRDVKRHVQPLIDEAEQQACADADDAALDRAA